MAEREHYLEEFGGRHIDSIRALLCYERDATDKVFRHVALSQVSDVERVEGPVYMGSYKKVVGYVESGTDIGIEVDKHLSKEVVLRLTYNTIAAVLAGDAHIEAYAHTGVNDKLLVDTIG